MQTHQTQRKFSLKQARENYAITDAVIVTIFQGRRLVAQYRSGQRLKGRMVKRADFML